MNPYNARLGLRRAVRRDVARAPEAAAEAEGRRAAVPLGSATMHAEVRGTFSELGFNGKIDRAGVYGRVLSDAELDAIAAGGAPPAEGVVAQWDTSRGLRRGRHRRRRARHRAQRRCTGAASTARCAR